MFSLDQVARGTTLASLRGLVGRVNTPTAIDYTQWTPRPPYDFVDLGCGYDAKRVCVESGNHNDWRLLGIDYKVRPSTFPNLELVQGVAEGVLNKLPDESIIRANADHFFNNLSSDDLASMLKLLYSKLVSDGVLEIGNRKRFYSLFELSARNCGFECLAPRELTDVELTYTDQGRSEYNVVRWIEGLPKNLRAQAISGEITVKALLKRCLLEKTDSGWLKKLSPDLIKQFLSRPEGLSPVKFEAHKI